MIDIKYRFLIIYMFFMFVCFMGKVNAYYKDLPLLGKVIYLDAGHGT